jgi:hypothetical protein
MDALKREEVMQRAVANSWTKEAVRRFAERYAEHCQFTPDGSPVSVIPRLWLALRLARQGKGVEIPVRHAALIQEEGPNNRKIFDVELPADEWNPEPYTIRIVTNATIRVAITVLPPEFRTNLRAKKKHRELRRIVDEPQNEPETPHERVVLPPPVRVGLSLGDALRRAMESVG